MRIYDVNLTGTSAAESSRAQETPHSGRAGSARAGEAGAGGTGDRVELSNTLGRLSQAMSADGSARASRVQALAAEYQSGSYRPDSAATSRDMVAEALAAGGKSS
ncbi:MAG: flagellar biosynthesis anti-sigma factor FlgM [Acidobacteriia bacterium]|nr:flagellar biosynthesis anti-sigma factor FlgM [Terriglobia bacterium]